MTTVLKMTGMAKEPLSITDLISRAERLEHEAQEYRIEARDPKMSLPDVQDLKAAAAELDGAAIHLRRMANRL